MELLLFVTLLLVLLVCVPVELLVLLLDTVLLLELAVVVPREPHLASKCIRTSSQIRRRL